MKARLPLLLPYALLGAAIIALLLTATWSPVRVTGTASAQDGQESTSYLFVQTAQSGSLVEASDGTATLTLTGVSPRATFFTDRPARDSGSSSVEDMIALLWEEGLPAPNAALVADPGGGEPVTLPLELSDPVYDAAAATITFTVAPLTGVTPGLRHLEFSADASALGDFGAAELFIDSGYNRCSVEIDNYSGHDLSLQSHSPASHDRWGSGQPPATVASGASASLEFKFHSNSANKHASLTYVTEGGDTADMTWSCRERSGGQLAEHFVTYHDGDECTVQDTAAISCEAKQNSWGSFTFSVTDS